MAKSLAYRLQTISRVFDIEQLLAQGPGSAWVVDYYTQSDWGYALFHSFAGSTHMALSPGARLDRAAHLAQAARVEDSIHSRAARRVLELGSGKGFNSIYLADRLPQVWFTGLDLTLRYLAVARRRARRLLNLAFPLGDFQSLPFRPRSFDLAFAVESLCHATDMAVALREVRRVLRPGGRLLVFDGFRNQGANSTSPELEQAVSLVEVSLAVERFYKIDDWVEIARGAGFAIMDLEERTQDLWPNLIRYQRLARAYFKFPRLSRVLRQILPPLLLVNAVAGLLMPFTVGAGVHGYYFLALQRQ